MSQSYELKATTRDRVGTGAARATRREGWIPAVIYGEKKPPVAISIPYKESFLRLHEGGFLTTVATVNVDGEKVQVIPRDYQLDPVRDFLIHVDFLRIGKNTRLTLEIPCQFINEEESPGLKRGGVLNVVRYTIEVECPADAIPDTFICDLTGMDINDSLHISAIVLPEGVEPTIRDRDFTIVTIASPAGLTEEAEEEEGVEEELEEGVEGEDGDEAAADESEER
jgi:large subunit ribosomal protein L25